MVLTSDFYLRTYSLDGAPMYKRQVTGLLSGQIKLVASSNGRYFAFIGPDQIVRITSSPVDWQLSDPIELKTYQFHTGSVKAGMFHPTDPTLFFTGGGMEGILIWRFNGIILEEKIPDSNLLSIRGDDVIKERLEKGIEIAPEFSIPINIEDESSCMECLKLNKRLSKRTELHLPLKHYVSDHEEKQLFYEDVSTRTLSVNDKNIHSQKLIGYNGNAHDNICYSKTNDWLAFTLGHKLIIEEFASKRQEVYLEQEAEISTIAIDNEMRYIATATGIPNRTTSTADIILYTIGVKPYLKAFKKLAFYQKGVQTLYFAKDQPNRLWSIGRYPENTLVLWDIETGVCLATEILNESIHSLCGFDKFNWVYGLSINYIALIRKEEGNNRFNIDKIIKENTEFTCAKQIEDNLLIGATNGNLLIYNPIDSVFIKNRKVSISEITCIEYNKGVISVSGGNTIYIWKNAISWHDIDKRPIEVTLDSDIISLISKNSNELLAGTSNDSLYLISIFPNGECATMKLHSSHSEVTALHIVKSPKLMISAGHNSIKMLSKENCDLVVEYDYTGDNIRCNSLVDISGLLIGCFNDGCIRFWSLRTLKQLRKAQISSEKLTAMSTNGTSVFIGNEAGSLFILNFVSIDPVLGNIQKIESELEGAITSIDFTCSPFVIASSSKGDIITWEVIGDLGIKSIPEKCELIERDRWNIFENPHGIEVSHEDLMIYRERQRHNVKAIIYKEDPRIAICGCDTLQYLYIRNQKTHEIEKRVVIDTFPIAISLLPIHNWIAIGGSDGTIKLKNIENLEEENVRVSCAPIETVDVFSEGTSIVTGGKGEIIKWGIELDN